MAFCKLTIGGDDGDGGGAAGTNFKAKVYRFCPADMTTTAPFLHYSTLHPSRGPVAVVHVHATTLTAP